ncbi:MAG: PD40 domain-containing protein [Bacteroidetes bacterium]|nr:PD40 domain-containing protein [Bacteroidota bacterium]
MAALLLLTVFGCSGVPESSTKDTLSETSSEPETARNATLLNSKADDFAPVLFTDGRTVLVTSNRKREGSVLIRSPEYLYGEAVYTATRAEGRISPELDQLEKWTSVAPFYPGIMDRLNTGTPLLHDATARLYFSATYLEGADGGADIYTLPWPLSEEAEALSLQNVNSPWWDGHPALSHDGTMLIFASDRIETLPSVQDTGRHAPQLWLSRLNQSGTWSSAEALPPPVNSGTAEMSPHFGADGWLYYSTKRWPETGFEIVRSRLLHGEWTEPERLPAPYNSAHDDVFPFLTADQMYLLFSSNRPGGQGGYDIWFAEMSYCVPLEVVVRLFDAERDTRQINPGAHIALEVIESATGRSVVKNYTGSDGRFYESCLEVGTHYTVKPVSKSCYQDTDGVDFTTPLPGEIGDGVSLSIDLRRLHLPEFHVVTDSIPFFVTGYWYPNTTAELERLRHRLETGKELTNANFIDTSDYDYDIAAQRVDTWFAQLYAAIDRMLVPLLDTCYGDADTLIIFVQGYVDPRGLAWGTFEEKQEVRTRSAVVKPGTVMQRQDGNVKLSHLRSWYAMHMIDDQMASRSERYRYLRDQQRIRYQCDGGYIGYGEGGDTEGEINDPLKRKFTVSVEVRRK